MSADQGSAQTAPPSSTDGDEARKRSRRLVHALSGTLASQTANGVKTARARAYLDALTTIVAEIIASEGRLDVRLGGEILSVNSVRLRQDLTNYVSFGQVLGAMRKGGVGVILCETTPDRAEWGVFVTSLLAVGNDDTPRDRIEELRGRLSGRYVRCIHVGPPGEGEALIPDEVERKEVAKRIYAQSVAVTKELFNGARMGRAANIKEVKHALHNIVDQVLENEASLAGLSTLKDYDDYAFTHSVNVCIFCVALGKRLGLGKSQLYDLGMAALVHDLGMSRIPRDIATKEAPLSAEEQAVMESHTSLGPLSIFALRDFGGIPMRSMIAAYEHHMKIDGSGYPKPKRPRRPSVYSRIVAVADAFDAATQPRAYSNARPADEVLRELWEKQELGFDPVVVKALINLLGIYPVGTFVILDTFELAIVHVANPDAAHINRPIVRIVCDPDGMWLSNPPLADLADRDSDGAFHRTIIKVTDAERYGVQVSKYFV